MYLKSYIRNFVIVLIVSVLVYVNQSFARQMELSTNENSNELMKYYDEFKGIRWLRPKRRQYTYENPCDVEVTYVHVKTIVTDCPSCTYIPKTLRQVKCSTNTLNGRKNQSCKYGFNGDCRNILAEIIVLEMNTRPKPRLVKLEVGCACNHVI